MQKNPGSEPPLRPLLFQIMDPPLATNLNQADDIYVCKCMHITIINTIVFSRTFYISPIYAA